MVVAPLLVPLVELLAALILSLLAITAPAWLRPALNAFPSLPGVGNIVAKFGTRIINALQHALEGWLDAPAGQVARLFHWLGRYSILNMDAVRDTFLRVEDALLVVRRVVVPALIHAAVHPLALALHELQVGYSALDRYARREIPRLDDRADRILHELRVAAEAPVGVIMHELLPALRRDVHAIEAEVGSVAAPLPGTLWGGLEGVEGELGDLVGRLDAADAWKLLAAAGGIFALVRLIEAEAGLGRKECRDKVRGVCTTDPAEWQGLLALLAGGLAWGGLAELIAVQQQVAGELLPDLLALVEG